MLTKFDAFIAAVSAETKIKFQPEAAGKYQTTLEFEGGRKQTVHIYLGKDDAGDPIIEYFSRICPIEKDNGDLFFAALVTNTRLTYGAIAINGKNLILKQTNLLNNLDPERFLKSLSYVAAKADELEEELTSNDNE